MLTFIVEGFRNQRDIGTFLPSSRWLARAMTEPARQATRPKRVLEVGPGTGAFTSELLTLLDDGDSLDLVECNPTFCDRLETRLVEPYRREQPGIEVRLHRDRIEHAPLDGVYDFIVCSLPFKVFEPATVRAIFRRLLCLLAPDGQLTYYEYAGVRVWKTPLLGPSARRKLHGVDAIARTLHRRHSATRRLVWLNIMPAFAVRLGHADRPRPSANGRVLAAAG